LVAVHAVSDVVGEIAAFHFLRKKVCGVAEKAGGTRKSPDHVIFWIRSSWRVDNRIVSGWVGFIELSFLAVH
jgi:hypothetical protein